VLFRSAFDFRRVVQRTFAEHWAARPAQAPLARHGLPKLAFPKAVSERWPAASEALLAGAPGALAALPIDHEVSVVGYRGGIRPAKTELARFIGSKLDRYEEDRNHPDKGATSGLSPYLHFGQLSAHRIVSAIAE